MFASFIDSVEGQSRVNIVAHSFCLAMVHTARIIMFRGP